MILVFTILMYIFQFLAIDLLVFLAYRYRANIASIRKPGLKATWSRLFTLFIISALLTESLTWTQGYIKCLDTSDELSRLMGPSAAQRMCLLWAPINDRLKHSLFTLYLLCELVAVCSFQALVLERYRKVSNLFPVWTSKYALPIYTALYIPIGMAACLLSLLEFWTSPSTLISRSATINTISSSIYCLWIVLTGVTDAVLSFLIVTKVRRGRREYQTDQAGAAKENGLDLALPHNVVRDAQFKPLRRLQIFFAAIILFDFSILSLTVLKKTDGHGINGHAFAYEVASIEIAFTLVHCTMTLCFMQFLGSILRATQPQFEFVLGTQESSIQVVNQTVFTNGPVTFSWTSRESDLEAGSKKPLGAPICTLREIAPDDISIVDYNDRVEEIQVVDPQLRSDTNTITTIL